MAKHSSISIDLGSTSIKVAGVDKNGQVVVLAQSSAPDLTYDGLKVIGDGEEYIQDCLDLLDSVKSRVDKQCNLAITSQRSSFLVWNKKDGHVMSPMISWQDRSYSPKREFDEKTLNSHQAITGLVPSPYYLAGKLRAWFDENSEIDQEDVFIGSLDTFLVYRLSQGKLHVCDRSMAARMSLLDINTGKWSERLLEDFKISISCLPELIKSSDLSYELDETWNLRALVADQSASLLGYETNPGDVCVNIGTGVFALLHHSKEQKHQENYQYGLLYGSDQFHYFSEGALNGLTRALKECRINWNGHVHVSSSYFCCPDSSGLGAPHWRPDMNFFTDCENFQDQSAQLRGSILMEGVVFRVRQMLDDLAYEGSSIVLSGGHSNNKILVSLLTSLSKESIYVTNESEFTSRGALKLVGEKLAKIKLQKVSAPFDPLFYKKYLSWKDWLAKSLESSS